MLLLAEMLDADSHHTLFAVRAVISHYDDLITGLADLILHDDKFPATSGNYREHTVAGSLQTADDRQHGSCTQTTACADDRTELLDMRRVAQRTNDISYLITGLLVAELGGRHTHLLNHQCNSTSLSVSIGNGQRHTLRMPVNTHDDKVAGLAAISNQRSFDLHAEDLRAELLLAYNLKTHLSLP